VLVDRYKTQQEALELYRAALRRIHDLDDVWRAISVAARLSGDALQSLEEVLLRIGEHLEEAGHE
jgi:hypothetical protein